MSPCTESSVGRLKERKERKATVNTHRSVGSVTFIGWRALTFPLLSSQHTLWIVPQTAIQDDLGLKLEAALGSSFVLVTTLAHLGLADTEDGGTIQLEPIGTVNVVGGHAVLLVGVS